MNNNNSRLTNEVKKILANEYSKENLPDNLYSYFEEKYLYYVEDEEQYGIPIDMIALDLSKGYVRKIAEQLAIGHCFDWAIVYASCLEEDSLVNTVYYELKEHNEDLSLSELHIHAKSYGQDKYFEKFFIELVTEYCKNYSDAELEYHSSQYSKIYHQSIAEGKSECYAQKYAELKAIYESPVVDESLRLVAEIFDFADQKGIDTTDIRNNCDNFADDCEDAYVNERLFSDINKLREKYKEDWQQEMLTILYNRYMDEYRDYQSKVKYQKPRKPRNSSLIDDTLDMMFPDGIDDGFTGVIAND